jgi:hypothetical protein
VPYIDEKRRLLYDDFLEGLCEELNEAPAANFAGDLNYIISTLLSNRVNGFTKLNYDMINEIVGVLECAKMEFYRRVAIDYERKKIIENGDVY